MAQISKTERLLNLVSYLLKERQPVLWREIAGKVMGYDDRSDPESLARRFERDKSALKEMGIPVVYYPAGTAEKEGYLIPREACFLDRLELSPRESTLLNVVTELAMRRGGSGFSPDLMSAIQKLRFDTPTPTPVAHIPPPQPPPQIAEPERDLEPEPAPAPRKRGRPPKKKPEPPPAADAVDANAPPSAASQAGFQGSLLDLDLMDSARGDPNLGVLSQALISNQRVQFKYYAINSDETRERNVDPYGLGFARGAWYLVGYDQLRTALRSFRLDRIRGLALPVGPERAFRPPAAFRVQDHIERPPWEMAETPPFEVTIEVAPAIAWFVEDLVAGKRPAEHRADGSAALKMDVRDRAAFVRWVLAHGRHIKIVEPRDLREELLETIRGLEDRHGGEKARPPTRAARTPADSTEAS